MTTRNLTCTNKSANPLHDRLKAMIADGKSEHDNALNGPSIVPKSGIFRTPLKPSL